jgi:hypothetical protein
MTQLAVARTEGISGKKAGWNIGGNVRGDRDMMEKEEIMQSVSAHCLSAVWLRIVALQPSARLAVMSSMVGSVQVVSVWAVLVTAVTEVVGDSQAGDRRRRLGAFSGIRPCRRQQLRRLLPARATAAGYVYFLVPGIQV